MPRIVSDVAGERFGPNTAQVDAFLDRLRRLTLPEWEAVMKAAPGVGAIPDLEIRQSPEYFKALDSATRVAKREVFPGSESAFYDAMRTAQLVADASAFQPSTRPEPGKGVRIGDRFKPGDRIPIPGQYMCTVCRFRKHSGQMIEENPDGFFPPAHHSGALWELEDLRP